MELYLTKQQKLVRELAKEFADTYVRPLAAEIDEEERFPEENVQKMRECGMMGIPFSKELGGSGGDMLGYIICVHEISKACATTGVILASHVSLAANPLNDFGTAAQKEKFLRPLIDGTKLGAFALTEPNAGTDASSQQTTATEVEGGYILRGTKLFITNGGYADTYIVFAMTDRSKGTRGITAFVVEKGTEGFSFGPKEKKMGIRGSSTCELIFKDCFIPKENLLGTVGGGFKIAMATLDGGRIGIAAQALGIAEGALEEAIAYTKERKQFGKSISSFQNSQFALAEMHVKVEAAKHLVYEAADRKGRGLPFSKHAAMAKLYASTVAMEVTTRAVQLFGGYGYTRDYPVERMMRDAKITEIYEGTSEVQKMVIAANILR